MSKSKLVPSEDQSLNSRLIKISNKIRQLRINAGYTSYEYFAYEIEMSRMQYWRLEKGRNMTLETLFTVLDAHKITLKEFFKDID